MSKRIWFERMETAARWKKQPGYPDGVEYRMEIKALGAFEVSGTDKHRSNADVLRYQARKTCCDVLDNLLAPVHDLIDVLSNQPGALTDEGRAVLDEFVEYLEAREIHIVDGWMASFGKDA